MAASKEYTDPQQFSEHVESCFRKAIKKAKSVEDLIKTTSSHDFSREIMNSFFEMYHMPVNIHEDFKSNAVVEEAQAQKGATFAIGYINKRDEKKKFERMEAAFQESRSISPFVSRSEARKRLMDELDVSGVTMALGQRFIRNDTINAIGTTFYSQGGDPGEYQRQLDRGYAQSALTAKDPQQAKENEKFATDANPEFQTYVGQGHAINQIAPILLSMPGQVNKILNGNPIVTEDQKGQLQHQAQERHQQYGQWLESPIAKNALAPAELERRKKCNAVALGILEDHMATGRIQENSSSQSAVSFGDSRKSSDHSASSDDDKTKKDAVKDRKENFSKRLSRTFSSSHVNRVEGKKSEEDKRER